MMWLKWLIILIALLAAVLLIARVSGNSRWQQKVKLLLKKFRHCEERSDAAISANLESKARLLHRARKEKGQGLA